MTIEQFFSKYANTPLKERNKLLPNSQYTLNEVYDILMSFEKQRRNLVLLEDGYLIIANRYFNVK